MVKTMRKAEAVYASTMEELVSMINSWFSLLGDQLKGFRVVSISHCHPTEQHPKYSALIVYEHEA